MSNPVVRRAAAIRRRHLQRAYEEKVIRADALLGNALGVVPIPGEANRVYARLLADESQVVHVRDTVGLALQAAGRPIALEAVLYQGQVSDWVAVGYSRNITYPGDTSGGPVAQHDHPAGNVNIRAFTPLRCQAQLSADLTVKVLAGFYQLNGLHYLADASSPAFVPPLSGARIDAVCVNAAGVLSIVQGAFVIVPPLAGFPGSGSVTIAIPVNVIALGAVRVVAGMTQIGEDSIVIDPRAFLSLGGAGSGGSGHWEPYAFNDEVLIFNHDVVMVQVS